MDISLSAKNIIEFGGFHITNSVLAGLLTSLIVMVIMILAARKASIIPGRLQMAIEMLMKLVLDLLISAYGSEARARKYLPFYITLFFFLIIANQFSVIPLVTNLVTPEGVLFKVSTADFSQTIALALISIVGAHVIAFSIHPIGHIGSFIKIGPLLKSRSVGDFLNGLLELFLGVLDIIGEIAKVISLSARLFGNIFAGEVMVAVIAGIAVFTSYFVPVPFLALSIFSGFVQAFVFMILSMQFMAGTINNVVDKRREEAARRLEAQSVPAI